jgi:chromosome segregation protein
MILKSLDLQGFKTFPDKTTLSFEKGITSVVGPNGSGKSNISDAMRWVLGEQSVRTLRCSKMEDVIFGGTPQRKALGFAEVTLTIDNSDRRLPFDNDTVAVTRRYYRSGDSEYLLNKATVRLKDINELFMDTGLGRDGYSIIGQGKIDSIVAARSEDRREIFEEAAGISRYRYRKEESERRLNKAEENLVRLRDILTELEERVEPLRIQAEKAEKFIAYDSEKKELEIGIWLETLERSGKVLREHSEKIDLARAQHQAIEEEIQQITEQIEENYRETNSCTAKMDEARNQASALDEEAVRREGEAQLIQSEISHNQQDIDRLQQQISSVSASEEDMDREIQGKQQEAAEKEKQIQAVKDKLLHFTQRLEELRQGADEATRKIEEASLLLAEKNAALSQEKIQLSSVQSSTVEVRRREESLEDSIRANREKWENLQQEAAELQTMLRETEEKIQQEENTVKGYEIRLSGRKKKAEEAKALADKLTLDANEQERRAKLLEDLERNLEGFAQSVKSVMKEAGRGMLPGICGPVTKLLHVPREYAVALETALGGAMQNIVTETEQDAKKAIGFLKSRDLGRATFLPLTTIKGSVIHPDAVKDMPGYVGVASDLCSCEEKFAGIRESLLGRVAVAEDLDSAVSIAKKAGYKFRVVSLDGQVVNAGGSLTGGSKGRNSGLLSRSAEIQRIREKAGELREKASQAAMEYKEKQQELSACEGQLDAAKGQLSSLQQDRVRMVSECARAARDLENAEKEKADMLREKEEAGNRLAALRQQEQEAREKIQKFTEEVEICQANAAKLSGSREEQMTRCNDISATIQEIRLTEYSAEKDRDTLLQAVEDLQQRKRDSKGAVVRLEEEIGRVQEKIRILQENGEIKEKEMHALREQAQKQRDSVASLGEKRTQLEQQSGALRAREREAGVTRENVGKELARLQERSDNLQKEYDTIISRLWEEYELTRREAEAVAKPVEDLSVAQRRLTELKNKIKGLGSVNVGAVVEYQEVSKRYAFMKEQIGDVEKSKTELLQLIGDLTKHMKEQYTKRFAEINQNFGTIFRELFGGGAAELSFTDDSDVLSSGIEIKVQPPGKIVSHIEALSGGEKALVAISIYFAIMRVNPPPFCVLDEIEAALDDVNVNRYAQYLRRMSGRTQFITITHRRGTMEGSDMLYGVTMQDQGISKLLALKTEEAVEQLG